MLMSKDGRMDFIVCWEPLKVGAAVDGPCLLAHLESWSLCSFGWKKFGYGRLFRIKKDFLSLGYLLYL